MASSASSSLKLEKMEVGVETSWGAKSNINYDIIDSGIAGVAAVSTTGGDTTLSDANYTNDDAKKAIIDVSGTLSSNANIIVPNLSRIWRILNRTTGSFTVSIKTSSGDAVEVTQGSSAILVCDGSNVMRFIGALTNITTGAPNTSSGAAASAVSVTPFGDLTSTTVQAALAELQGDIDAIEADLLANYQPLDADLTAIAGLASTKGNVIVGGASGWSAVGVGTDGYAMIADSASAPGMKWAALVPAGTVAIFYQSGAPTGWALSGSENNYALRLVSSNGGSTGGSSGFTNVFAERTIAQGNLPAHTHSSGTLTVSLSGTTTLMKRGGTSASYSAGGLSGLDVNLADVNLGISAISGSTGAVGSGAAMDFAVQYINVIKCAKSAY